MHTNTTTPKPEGYTTKEESRLTLPVHPSVSIHHQSLSAACLSLPFKIAIADVKRCSLPSGL